MTDQPLDALATLAQPVIHTHCRICSSPLTTLLSLGAQYLCDFPASADFPPYPAVPLTLARCTSSTCGLVQLTHTTPREWMYRHYWYRSGTNESMIAELRNVVESGLAVLNPRSPKGLVVGDIGANDGTLLAQYPEVLKRLHGSVHGLTRIAWEPARNLYQACRPHCEVLFPDFFGGTAASVETPVKIHLLTAIAMFYDLEDPHAFIADVAASLHKDGVCIIQQAYLLDMLRTSGYDNIGHEHLEYYHLQPLEALLAAHGLEVFHVERRAINGGSFRVYVGWIGRHPVQESVALLRAQEADVLSDLPRVWYQFALQTDTRIHELKHLLEKCASWHLAVDIYGASTKGATLLQACGIDKGLIRQCWERSPEKCGRFYGTTGIPIVPEAEGRSDPPAVLLVLPWAFRESFVAREQEFLAQGGSIIFPLPTVEVVGQVGGVGVAGVNG